MSVCVFVSHHFGIRNYCHPELFSTVPTGTVTPHTRDGTENAGEQVVMPNARDWREVANLQPNARDWREVANLQEVS
uniref:Uncharacterized protein n=1 Tax=Anguilla anguilla TaxID=7936 RepID=A0A0E9W515_ANGAN